MLAVAKIVAIERHFDRFADFEDHVRSLHKTGTKKLGEHLGGNRAPSHPIPSRPNTNLPMKSPDQNGTRPGRSFHKSTPEEGALIFRPHAERESTDGLPFEFANHRKRA
jgi:hypothetical protein